MNIKTAIKSIEKSKELSKDTKCRVIKHLEECEKQRIKEGQEIALHTQSELEKN